MPYRIKTWKDHVVQSPKTYYMQQNANGTITLVPANGEIIQQGTPMNATNFNRMESGICDATISLDIVNSINQAMARERDEQS